MRLLQPPDREPLLRFDSKMNVLIVKRLLLVLVTGAVASCAVFPKPQKGVVEGYLREVDMVGVWEGFSSGNWRIYHLEIDRQNGSFLAISVGPSKQVVTRVFRIHELSVVDGRLVALGREVKSRLGGVEIKGAGFVWRSGRAGVQAEITEFRWDNRKEKWFEDRIDLERADFVKEVRELQQEARRAISDHRSLPPPIPGSDPPIYPIPGFFLK